jgi:hypothetical protein
MPAAIIRAACAPFKFVDELAAALKDAIDGAITGAAIGSLQRRGYQITPPQGIGPRP